LPRWALPMPTSSQRWPRRTQPPWTKPRLWQMRRRGECPRYPRPPCVSLGCQRPWSAMFLAMPLGDAPFSVLPARCVRFVPLSLSEPWLLPRRRRQPPAPIGPRSARRLPRVRGRLPSTPSCPHIRATCAVTPLSPALSPLAHALCTCALRAACNIEVSSLKGRVGQLEAALEAAQADAARTVAALQARWVWRKPHSNLFARCYVVPWTGGEGLQPAGVSCCGLCMPLCTRGRSDVAGRALADRQAAQHAALVAAITSALAAFADHVRSAADKGGQLADFVP
jgi:hypothetical protein